MTVRSALWTQGGSTSAEEDRALIAALYAAQGSGILGISGADGKVIQHGTPNMSVDVAPFRVAVAGTESLTVQGVYAGWLDASLNVVIAASDPTNPRIDLVVAKFQDAQYSGATNAFSVVAVTGTPAGSPVAPAAPANSIILAQISVAATSTTVLTAAITDKRVWTGAKPWGLPWGEVPGSYAQVTASVTGFSGSTTDAAGLTTGAITYVANRIIEVRALSPVCTQNTSAGLAKVWIADGAGVNKGQMLNRSLAAGERFPAYSSVRLVTVAGAQTYKVRATTSAGTLDIGAGVSGDPSPAFIQVIDLGPSGNPA